MDKNLMIFGDLFIKSVRDNSLFVLEGILNGHMKSSIDKEMHNKIKQMSEDEQKLLRDLAYRMVDISLHNMLAMFENDEDWCISNRNENISNINSLTDGLTGELYTTDGWIHQYSSYEPSPGL